MIVDRKACKTEMIKKRQRKYDCEVLRALHRFPFVGTRFVRVGLHTNVNRKPPL